MTAEETPLDDSNLSLPFLTFLESFPFDSRVSEGSPTSVEESASYFIVDSRSEVDVVVRRGRLRGLGESGGSSRRAVDALRFKPADPAEGKICGEGSPIALEEGKDCC